MKRRQPPYARLAARRIARGAHNIPGRGTLIIHAGHDAWDYQGDSRPFVLSTPDMPPESLDWSIAARFEPPALVFVHGADDAHLDSLARSLLRDGARRVYIPAASDKAFRQRYPHGVIYAADMGGTSC